jgi:hypothetical protein
MKIVMIINLILFLSNDYRVECAQPYFPPQITFSMYDNQAIYAIDQLNQNIMFNYN